MVFVKEEEELDSIVWRQLALGYLLSSCSFLFNVDHILRSREMCFMTGRHERRLTVGVGSRSSCLRRRRLLPAVGRDMLACSINASPPSPVGSFFLFSRAHSNTLKQKLSTASLSIRIPTFLTPFSPFPYHFIVDHRPRVRWKQNERKKLYPKYCHTPHHRLILTRGDSLICSLNEALRGSLTIGDRTG